MFPSTPAFPLSPYSRLRRGVRENIDMNIDFTLDGPICADEQNSSSPNTVGISSSGSGPHPARQQGTWPPRSKPSRHSSDMPFGPNKSDLVRDVILQIYALTFVRKLSGVRRTGSFWKHTMMLILLCMMATLVSKPSTTN